MRPVIRVNVSDITLVRTELTVILREVVCQHTIGVDQIRENVLPEFVTAIKVSGITKQCLAQRRGIEHINPHAGQRH